MQSLEDRKLKTKHLMSLDALRNNPMLMEKILEIQKIAKYPLILITWASGVGKDTIISSLLERNSSLTKTIRATTREKKERDKEGDFVYLTPTEMETQIQNGEVLFQYDSHRNDGSQYWFFYEELKKLKDQPLIAPVWPGGLGPMAHIMRPYMPVIICSMIRNEDTILQALSGRHSDQQTQKNIQDIKKNLSVTLDHPSYSQIIVQNQTGNIDQTVSEIEDAIRYYTDSTSLDTKLLQSIFNIAMVRHIDEEDLTLFKQNLTSFLTNEEEQIDKEKVDLLTDFMLTQKFSNFMPYVDLIKHWPTEKNHKDISAETSMFYTETAKFLDQKGFHKESQKIMLQIGESDYSSQGHTSHETKEIAKTDIPHCIHQLSSLYESHHQEGGKLIFTHAGFAFGHKATNLAEKTLSLALHTVGIHIQNVTSMFGEFHFKLSKPYHGIEDIQCQIIKDRV